MKIRTKCKDCAYLRTGDKCVYEHDTYRENDEVYVDSYCRFKRQDPVSNEDMFKEDLEICMVLDCFGKDEVYILKNLEKEIHESDFVKEWIIAANCSYSMDTIKKIKSIFDNHACGWCLRVFTDEEAIKFDSSMIENESIKDRKLSNWYSYKKISEPYDKNVYREFVSRLKTNTNFFEVSSDSNFIRNYFIFKEVGGNFNGLFEDKIESFDNYKDGIIKI